MNLCSQNSGSVEDKKVTIVTKVTIHLIYLFLLIQVFKALYMVVLLCIVPTKIAMMHTQQIDIFYIHDMNCCFF